MIFGLTQLMNVPRKGYPLNSAVSNYPIMGCNTPEVGQMAAPVAIFPKDALLANKV